VLLAFLVLHLNFLCRDSIGLDPIPTIPTILDSSKTWAMVNCTTKPKMRIGYHKTGIPLSLQLGWYRRTGLCPDSSMCAGAERLVAGFCVSFLGIKELGLRT